MGEGRSVGLTSIEDQPPHRLYAFPHWMAEPTIALPLLPRGINDEC